MRLVMIVLATVVPGPASKKRPAGLGAIRRA